MFTFRTLVGVALVLAAGGLFAVNTAIRTTGQPPLSNPAAVQPQPAPVVQPDQAPESMGVLTEALGLVSGLQLYQTYLNIGLLADVRAEGLYEAGELSQLLGTVVTPLEQVDKQLGRVAAIKGLSKDDVAALARMRKIVGQLQAQGKSLQTFWDTGVQDHGKRYEIARQAAWKELDDLLGLTLKDGIAPEPRPAEKKP